MATKHERLYTGRSGQLAIMAEFLIREMNVAIPEVDIGDDIVVVNSADDLVTRIQVKTAKAKNQETEGHFTAQFLIPLEQLTVGPERLVYAFVIRRNDAWEEFIIVRRSVLEDLRANYDIGSDDSKGNLKLRLAFKFDGVFANRNKKVNFHPFRNRFTNWPPKAEIPIGVVSTQ